MTRHIVMFSGGIGSWAAARRVADRHGTADMTLLFTDTMIEDADLYRFLDEAATNIDAPLVKIADGRTPFQVFRDVRMLGNSRIDPCSRILKREISDKWLVDNCDPADTVVYLGIDWTEAHRFDGGDGKGSRHRYASNGWRCEAPMCEAPFILKAQMLHDLRDAGIKQPRLYDLGFAHNNCGGGLYQSRTRTLCPSITYHPRSLCGLGARRRVHASIPWEGCLYDVGSYRRQH